MCTSLFIISSSDGDVFKEEKSRAEHASNACCTFIQRQHLDGFSLVNIITRQCVPSIALHIVSFSSNPFFKGTLIKNFIMFICFAGLGYLMVMISFLVTWYIMVVLMWTLYFLYNSFFPVLPWTTCDNSWNTKACRGGFS